MSSKSVDPVNWPSVVNRRFREASKFAREGRHIFRRNTDVATWQLYSILKAREEGREVRQMDAGSERVDKYLIRALEIHEAGQGVERSRLQAYLLTDLSHEEIGQRIGVSVETVAYYEQCFFDVRQESNNQIKNEVVAACKDLPADRLVADYLWKAVALVGGVESLENILVQAEISTLQDATAVSATEAKSIGQLKIAEAAKSIDMSDPGSIRELRRMLESLDDVKPRDELTYIHEQIEGIFAALPFSVGEPDPARTPTELMPFELAACELNGEEIQRVAFGQELPNKEEILSLRFPKGPNDHDALSIPQGPPQHSPAPVQPVETSDSNPFDGNVDGEQISQSPVHSAMPTSELSVKLDRVRENREKIEQQQASREEAVRQAARNAADLQEMAEKARMLQLDREWEAFVGDATGAAHNRKWIQFKQQHPKYILPDARERLAASGKRN